MASTSRAFNKPPGYLKKIIGVPVGKLFPLSYNDVTIGRNSQSAEIFIPDSNVSRKHCLLKWSEDGWFIKDLKSVNGTYLDGKFLEPGVLYPLKDGAGIYLGPPGDAPVAFIFLTKLPNEQSSKENENDCSQTKGGTSQVQDQALNKRNKCIKRRSDSDAPTTNECLAQRKRIATSSSPINISSRLEELFKDIVDEASVSDCSISSLDSLKTRVRKMSAKKDKSKSSKSKNNAASTSASPQLRSSSNANVESKPSTSSIPAETLDRKRNKVSNPGLSKEFAVLSALFKDLENSSPETIKGEDSQSLLNDSKILIDSEPYPFSQPLPSEKAESKRQNKSSTESEGEGSVMEQLQKATLELKKLKKDKIYLYRLVKDLRSEEFLKKKFQAEYQKMLEDELMCNICTEIFMKAVTLGCSHTFCEYCINEWKKKQKKCPICREKIASETKILVLDSFINKAVEQLDLETQRRRKELSTTREKAKVAQQKKKGKRSRGRGRVRRVQSDSSDADDLNSLSERIFQELFQQNNSPSVEVLHGDDLGHLSSSDLPSDLSESDMSVEGDGYFGGYGRCYNCGRRGHWANGCPFM